MDFYSQNIGFFFQCLPSAPAGAAPSPDDILCHSEQSEESGRRMDRLDKYEFQNINRETFFCKFFRFKLIFPFQTKNMTILTKDKPAASRQKIGHHNDKNRYGSDVPDDEIHRGEDHIGSLQHPLVGELPADIGLLHLPADKYHDKQGPSRH